MTGNSPNTLEDLRAELERDPEFQKEYRRQKPYYRLLVSVIRRRKELKLTQAELAARAGTHQSTIARLESGEHNIRLSTLIEIAEALESEVDIQLPSIHKLRERDYRRLFQINATNAPAEGHSMGQKVTIERVG